MHLSLKDLPLGSDFIVTHRNHPLILSDKALSVAYLTCKPLLERLHLGVSLLNSFDLLLDETVALLPVACDLCPGKLLPLGKELNVVLLGLVLDHLVVVVHVGHQLDVPLMHLPHVFLDLEDVGLRKVERNEPSAGSATELAGLIFL